MPDVTTNLPDCKSDGYWITFVAVLEKPLSVPAELNAVVTKVQVPWVRLSTTYEVTLGLFIVIEFE